MKKTTTLADRLRRVCDADLSEALEGSGVSACAAKMVLMALLRYTDARGVCWPSESRLWRDTRLHRARVLRVYRVLMRRGILHEASEIAGTKKSRCVRVDFDALRNTECHPAQQGASRSATESDALRGTNTPENDSNERLQEHRIARDEGAVGESAREERRGSGEEGATPGVRAMLDLGVDAKVVRTLHKAHGDDALADAAHHARPKRTTLRDPAAYAAKACREGWKSPERVTRERVQREEEARERQRRDRREQEERDQDEQMRTMRLNEEARERVCAMPDDERERLWDAFVRERCST